MSRTVPLDWETSFDVNLGTASKWEEAGCIANWAAAGQAAAV